MRLPSDPVIVCAPLFRIILIVLRKTGKEYSPVKIKCKYEITENKNSISKEE